MSASHPDSSAPRNRARWWVAAVLPLAVVVAGIPIGEAVAEPGDTQAYRVMREKLANTTIDLEFEDAPVLEVFAYIGRYAGINLVIDQQVKDTFEADGRVISLSLKRVTLGDALEIVMDVTALKSSFRNSVLFITTPEQANLQVYMKLYDVRDMTFKIRDFAAPRIEIGDENDVDPIIVIEEEPQFERPTTDEIMELCLKMTGRGTWDNGSTSVSQINGLLVVVQSAEVHLEIEKLLAMLRSMG